MEEICMVSRENLDRIVAFYALIGAVFQVLLIYFVFYSPSTFIGLPASVWVIVIFAVLSLVNGIALYVIFNRAVEG
jgi:hypothetical protein